MNVYSTPYGDSLSRRITEITNKLQGYIASGSDVIVKTPYVDLYKIDYREDSLPQWNFPIIIKDRAYIDTRPYLNKQGEVSNTLENGAAITRAILELEWVQSLESYQAVAPQVAAIYGTWLSNVISVRYNRSSADALLLKAAYCMLYICNTLPFDNSTFDKLKKGEYNTMLLKQTSRYTDIPMSFLNDVFFTESEHSETFTAMLGSKPDYATRLNGTLHWANAKMESPIEDFGPSALLNMVVGGSWVGNLSGELVSTALYHPPILVSLISRTLSFSYYERTGIGRAVKEMGRKAKAGDIDSWVKKLMAEAGE